MAISSHHVFKWPDDPAVVIWRYMDFAKFVSMLESSALYFSRADRLGDAFEGSYPQANKLARLATHEGPVPPEEASKMFSTGMKQLRTWMFVNCWHVNTFESAAMWKLYAKTSEAIAIRSSFERLSAQQLDDDVFAGLVEYIDFDDYLIPEGNVYYPYLHKRKSFSHECELRAVTMKIPDIGAEQTINGLEMPVSLPKLIDAVYVAPTCPAWFRMLVQRVCGRYGLDKPVLQSSLDAEPLF